MCTGTTFLLFFGSRIRSLVKSYLPSVTALLRPSGFFSLTKFMRSCTFPFLLRLATAIFLLFLDKSVSSSPFSALVSVLYKIVSWWESCGARDLRTQTYLTGKYWKSAEMRERQELQHRTRVRRVISLDTRPALSGIININIDCWLPSFHFHIMT